MKKVREAEREKQASKNAKRNSEYVPVGASASSQGSAAGGGARFDAAAAMDIAFNSPPPTHQGEIIIFIGVDIFLNLFNIILSMKRPIWVPRPRRVIPERG